MSPKRWVLTIFGLASLGTVLVVVAPIAGGAAPAVKPVIGKPSAVPARPITGKRFAVSFEVTRRDTGAPLTYGRMTCDPSVGGRTIRHQESFKGGTARLALVVPASAAGRLLRVKVTIESGRSATRIAAFQVRAAPPPSLSIGSATSPEGNAGTTTLSFPVRLSAAAGQTVSVEYATADGTARAPSDYAAATGTIAFQPGETAKTVTIGVLADTAVEPDEHFTVSLSSPVNATLGSSVATGTITNDDTAVPVTPGAYKGATQNGNYVFFDVLPDRTLVHFRVNDLPQRCGSGVRTSGGESLGDSVYPIRKDGRFSGTTTWTGSVVEEGVEYTRRDTRLTGVFGSPVAATGTIMVTTEVNFEGKHYRCLSGTVTWSATREG